MGGVRLCHSDEPTTTPTSCQVDQYPQSSMCWVISDDILAKDGSHHFWMHRGSRLREQFAILPKVFLGCCVTCAYFHCWQLSRWEQQKCLDLIYTHSLCSDRTLKPGRNFSIETEPYVKLLVKRFVKWLDTRPRNRLSWPLMVNRRQLLINSIDQLDFWPFSWLNSTQSHGSRPDRLDSSVFA